MLGQLQAKHYIEQGALFVAVGSNTGLHMNSSKSLVDKFIANPTTTEKGGDSVYQTEFIH